MPTTAVHDSATRPILTFGVEREIAIVEGTLVAGLTAGLGFNLPAVGLAVVIVVVVHPLLKLAAKDDARMFRVYMRHLRYRQYYPAQAHPDAPSVVPSPWPR